MLKTRFAALAALALATGLASAAGDGRKTYIVQLTDEPAATYQGGVGGLAATQPVPGGRLDARAGHVQSYVNHLKQQQRAVAATVGRARVMHQYQAVFNGFSARLTPAEVKALRANGKVAAIYLDKELKLDTISTPRFLGLTAPGGLWSQTVGSSLVKGENMVIGVVDGGIWPENPSFSDKVDGSGVPTTGAGAQVYGPKPATFTGSCVAGEGFVPATHCNNKLIGAKFFNAGFLASGRTKHFSEFYSPRDSVGAPAGKGGHGDHTASTVAGNEGAPTLVNGTAFGPAAGVAPRARVAAYKVCWSYVDPAATDGTGISNGCFQTDTMAAIDAAVLDGVNAINYSISGSQTTVNDAVEQAFYRAALAGVFVAASAGNSGPANAVAHISPWITTVAASTHDRIFRADATLGNAAVYSGASVNTVPLSSSPLIRAEDAGIAGASANLNLCFSSPNELDPAKVAGKVVICTRGTNARVDKSLAVRNAGGVGMIMMDNNSGLVAEAHSVPTVHVTAADGAAIKSYAVSAGAAATASIGAFYAGISANAPVMAGFSSRGPNQGDSNVLKPDLTAPGVDVIAAVTPSMSSADRDLVAAGTLVPPPAWASYQGTSMSSPHVAGLALLLKQARPTWSPAAIKSALMTTAYSTLDDGLAGAQNGLLPWAQGAGHVNPNKALDPGLVYDAGKNDWVRYQCKVNRAAVVPASDCTTIGTLDETYNLNLPSITVGNVVGNVTVTRRVTNVGSASATYTASANLPGFTTLVTPSSLTLAPGASATFTVRLTTTTATEGVWQFGSMTWTDGVRSVRVPVQARVGKPITAPAGLTASTVSGTRLISVKTGFTGRMGAIKGGLKAVTLEPAASLSPGQLGSTALRNTCVAGSNTATVKIHDFAVPANAVVARFSLRDQDMGAPGGDDFDMIVITPSGGSVYSGNAASNESVQFASPVAGNYRVCVHAYDTASNGPSTYQLSSWVVTPSDLGGNFRVLTPSTVYAGSSATVGISWSGLPVGDRYLGAVQFTDLSGTVQATTVVRVETTGQPIQADEPTGGQGK
ncbi:MAG: peptidase S8 and S53 subtilisin kexin sedolisin [Leptothrix sp. (in: Bacteria)]|nr:peptidase S8 and S53 subtilisin kexin sedolisin [Leptothrix sp. (in: b-proteobacteria)]